MISRISRMLPNRRDDEGFAMVMVIGMAFVFALIVSLLIVVGINSLGASRRHDNFDAALASAENGIDQTLSRLQRAYVFYGVDYPVPNTGITGLDPAPTCSATPVAAPNFGSNPNTERDWAKSQIATMIAAHPGCLQHGAQGDFAVLKPSTQTSHGQTQVFQTIYAEGWSPSYGATNARTRLIKANYLFAPYKPSDAILTGCNLQLDSSTKVTTAGNFDPTLAAVHSNCTISVPNGNPIVTGPVSSTGDSGSTSSNKFSDNTGGVVTKSPEETIPVISAREVYSQQWSQYANNWYDLCPDGKVRQPSANGPCDPAAPVIQDMTQSNYFRGFTWTAPSAPGQAATWTLVNGAGDGVYYVSGGNVVSGTSLGNPVSNAVTIIASAVDDTVCQKVGGSIQWDHDDLSAPFVSNLFMLADADLSTGSNFYAGGVNADGTISSGLFVAGDQVNLQTSSAGAYGAVVAGDQCPAMPGEVNEIKNPTVYYDPNAEAPFTDIIDTTLWLEYVG
jgi:hypothetical protein